MKSFLHDFLRDDFGRSPGPHISLAVFGKHPGWNDHLDDISLDTPSLIAAKKLLYTSGIGGQLDAGAWEKLDEKNRLGEFHHVLVWARGGQCITGRLWRSRDGKGRAHYPMCACAHTAGVPVEGAIAAALPELERIEAAAALTVVPEKVRGIVEEVCAGLRETLSGERDSAGDPDFSKVDETFAGETLAPILAESRRIFGAYQKRRFKPRAQSASRNLRVPSVCDTPADDCIFWRRFFGEELDPDAPLLILRPLGFPWLDVIAGQPSSSDFFCLRASLEAIPCATGQPADEPLRAEARRIVDSIKAGPVEKEANEKRTWIKRFFGG